MKFQNKLLTIFNIDKKICATNTDINIAKMIVAGFTGQLKGWWDNYLSLQNKDDIFKTVKIENGQMTENAVYTLIVTMVK